MLWWVLQLEQNTITNLGEVQGVNNIHNMQANIHWSSEVFDCGGEVLKQEHEVWTRRDVTDVGRMWDMSTNSPRR